MGRRKRNRNRNRNNQQAWRQIRSHAIVQAVGDEERAARYSQEQDAYLKSVTESKLDLLSRTVLVGSVLPLREEKNVSSLRLFLARRYGPVQKLGKKGKGRFPMGRVTFHYKRDAEKIFGGKPLTEASKERLQVKIPCPSVGYKGSITVRPSLEYKGMNDDLNTSTTIQVNTTSLALGHWFPSGMDACSNLLELEHLGTDQQSTWVEEHPTKLSPIVSIDMEKAVVEMNITHGVDLQENASPLADLSMQNRFILSFRFKDLVHPMELCRVQKGMVRRKETFCIAFALKHPPRLSLINTNILTEWQANIRLTDMTSGGSTAIPGVGRCLGYLLEVSTVELDRMLKAKAFGKLKDMGLFLCDDDLELPRQAALIHAERRVHDSHRRRLHAKIASVSERRFGLLLRSILDNQSCSWFDMLDDILEGRDLFDLVNQGEGALVLRVLNEMQSLHGTTRHPAKMFNALYEADLDIDEVPQPMPDFCVSLPRILLTPCRVSLTGFEVEMSNRLVRKFIEREGFSENAFIRVSVGDENGDKLWSDDLSEQVESRIKSLALYGITVVKKRYLFLAYSSSQLKEQSLWFVCPERRWTIQQMRSSMGDFSACKTPAKYAARMGQCFSTTVDTAFGGTRGNRYEGLATWTKQRLGYEPSSSKSLRVKDNLPDITSYCNGVLMEHSDGVGLIRKEVLADLVKQVPFGPKYKKDISAIQIRFGGAKGVLVAWDFSKLSGRRHVGYDVCLRPSMVKFKASYDGLEVVACAQAIPYHLNRNVILLGSHLGIPDEKFLEMQAHHLESLNRMLVDSEFALSFLPSLSGPDGGLISNLQHMLSIGLKPDVDPFLYSCLHAARSHHLMQLRKKARVHVEKGVVLIGGIDELNVLDEGCVFLQVRRPDGDYEPVTGRVLVTKHPVMHPGDMRMLTAVDVPELRDKKHVVLFSQRGERPEADKMSGSDLDGDQFAITWDERLFLRETSPPMDYSPPEKPNEDGNITDDSLLTHFISHARNDNLGRIAMLWMDHASIEGSAGCSACLQLAKLASIAVDFPKSGVPATIPQELTLTATTPRPHWREMRGRRSFHCESIVGQLYDVIVDEMKSERNMPQSKCIAMAGRYRDNNGQILHLGDARAISNAKRNIYNPLIAQRLGWTGDELDNLLLEYADEQRYLYESSLLELMNRFKIKSEGEVATGCILKFHRLHKRRRHDVSEEVRRQLREIRKMYRAEFFTAVYHLAHDNRGFFENAVDDATDDVSEESLEWVETIATGAESSSASKEMDGKAKRLARRLAAAYYIDTYHQKMHADGSRCALYGFPWEVAADVIACGFRDDQS